MHGINLEKMNIIKKTKDFLQADHLYILIFDNSHLF
jgi:hypothetical protein